jgi:hypothetical protein
MKFEIKKFKSFMGTDCPGFNLDLWMDSKKLAFVVDDGSGACMSFYYEDKEEGQKFEDYCKSLPPLRMEDFPEGLKMDADLFVSLLVEQFQNERTKKKKGRPNA